MNYLAHLHLSQPNGESRFGNLLGDFMHGVQPHTYSRLVQAGLANHRLVDKFTDQHAQVIQAKQLFSARRRRFAGIIVDVSFDHFLIKHWSQFSDLPFVHFEQSVYQQLKGLLPKMPASMQTMIGSMVSHRWLDTYASLTGVGRALDNTAARIRFKHQFDNSIEEVQQHYAALEAHFLQFYPELQAHVRARRLEHG